MNKRQILASLNDIANNLDNAGLSLEANNIARVMKKIAQEMPTESNEMSGPPIPPQTKQNIINMVKNVNSINGVCYSLLTYDQIGQSHIDAFAAIEKDVTALKNLLPLYKGQNLL
jgi:hypothetical protein